MRLSQARRAICLALVLIFGFSSTGIAQVIANGQLAAARRGHTATALQDGKIVVIGGENGAGDVGVVELFDPATRTFSSLADSLARTDHSATLLGDGRVLVAGGSAGGSALDTTQIFNPVDGTFSAGPALQRARSGHSATLLADGKVLIVGGDAGGSAEIIDAVGQVSTLSGSLAEPRALHGAVLLQDGRVLIAGGVDAADASQVLDSAEIFDPATGAFSAAATTMGTARALASMRALPDGKVQIIGGDASFSMEIYDPATGGFNAIAMLPPIPEMLDATLTTQGRAALTNPNIAQHPTVGALLTPDDLALLDRADQTITEIPGLNQALVAGGVDSAGNVLDSVVLVQSSPAKITTDQTDYVAGRPVTMTGSGFLPNEQVNISLDERPDAYTDPSYVVTADNQGGFTFTGFAPQIIDLNRTFVLTATGQSSGYVAQTSFTDAGSLTLTPASGVVGTSVAVTSGGGPFGSSVTNVGIYWDGTINTVSGTLLTTCSTNGGGNITGTCTFTVPSSTPGAHTVVATQQNDTTKSTSTNFTVIGVPTQLAFTAQPISTTVNNTIGSSPAGGIKVSIRDVNGNQTSSTASVTIAIGTNFAGGTLSGTTTVAAVNGVATFSNLAINAVGAGYTLVASSGSLTGATSSSFPITLAVTTTAVSCTLTNLVVDNTQTCTATVTNTATVKTVPTGSVTWTTSAGGASQFGSTSCTLAPTGNPGQASCQVTYTPNATGSRTVTGTYVGDSNNTGSVGSTAAFNPALRSTSTVVSCTNFPVTGSLTASTCTATVFDTSGVGTSSSPTGTVSWTRSGGAGTFTPTSCTLSNPIDSSNSCSVTYNPGSAAPATLTGTYNASTKHATSNGTAVTNRTTTTLAVNAATGTFGGTVNLQATLTGGSTGSTINFTLNGASAGSALTDASGVATLNGVSLAGVAIGTYPGGVAATFAGDSTHNSSTGSNTLTVNSPAPTKLVITGSGTQTAGSGQNLTITAKDASNNTVTSYTGAKSLTFSGANASASPVTNPTVSNSSGTAIAFGTATSITFTNGVATVSGGTNGVMTLYKAETVDIAVTDGTVSAAGTDRLHVVVSAAAANKLAFGVQPTNTAAGSAITPAVTIQVQDQYGNVATGDSSSVTISISSPGVLSGTLTVAAVSGVATFSNIVPTKTGTGFTLHAVDGGLTAADSNAFDVTAGALHHFKVEADPSGNIATQTATVPFGIKMTAQDANDNTVTSFTGTVNLTVNAGTVAPTVSSAFASGVRTESVTLTQSGTGRTITATDPVSTKTGTSNAFDVNAKATTTAVVSNANPSTFGNSVTFTATVTGSVVTEGQVKFIEGGTCASPTTELQAAAAVDGSGQKTFTTSALTAGSHTVIACYLGTGNYAASDGSVAQTVNKASTSVTNITASSSTFGGTTNLSATVTPANVSGSVAFYINGSLTAIPASYDSSTGIATVSNHAHGLNASATPYSVRAAFTSSNTNYDNSEATNATALAVNKASTTVTNVTASPSTFGGTTNLAAKVNPTGVGGSVAFYINGSLTAIPAVYDSSTGNATVSNYTHGLDASLTAYSVRAVFTSSDANYDGSEATNATALNVDKAASTTTVTVADATFDGNPHGGTANVTGVGGLNQSLTVSYSGRNGTVYGPSTTAPTNAGDYTASATFAGDANHNGSSDSKDYTINKAPVTATAGNGSATYDGLTKSPSGCVVSGAYTGNLTCANNPASVGPDAGTTTIYPVVSGTGLTNFQITNVNGSYTIHQAPSTTTVTVANATYNGNPHGGTANVTGAGGLNQSLTVSYSGRNGTVYGPSTTAPTNAGDYTASASYGGDTNHTGSSDSKDYSIAKAPVTATAGGGSATYDSFTKTPSACVVSGAYTGDLTCANNPPSVGPGAGTTTIYPVVSGTGLTNFAITYVNGSYTIIKANPTCVVTGYHVFFDTFAHTATGSCTGVNGESLAGLSLTGTTHTAVGTYNDSWTFTDATGNYNNGGNTVSDSIGAWSLTGFYQPVDMTPPTSTLPVYNAVKGGSTVPFKFEVFIGSVEQTSTTAVKSVQSQQFACTAGYDASIDAIDLSPTGGTSLRYDTTGGQFIYNWQTPKKAGDCYRVTMTTLDGTTLFAYFKTK